MTTSPTHAHNYQTNAARSHSNYNIECTTTHSNSSKKTEETVINREGSTRRRQPDWHPKPKQTLLWQPASLHYYIVIVLSRGPSCLFFLKHHISKLSTGNVQSDLSISQKCKSRASTQRLQKTLAIPSCEEELHVWALNVTERWVGPKTLIMMSALFLIALQPNVCVNKDQRKRWKNCNVSHNHLIT
jgi:hypothetical protein